MDTDSVQVPAQAVPAQVAVEVRPIFELLSSRNLSSAVVVESMAAYVKRYLGSGNRCTATRTQMSQLSADTRSSDVRSKLQRQIDCIQKLRGSDCYVGVIIADEHILLDGFSALAGPTCMTNSTVSSMCATGTCQTQKGQ